jgi:hypothetical protein
MGEFFPGDPRHIPSLWKNFSGSDILNRHFPKLKKNKVFIENDKLLK